MIVHRIGAAAMVLLVPLSSPAHHSFAATFDSGITAELAGEITDVRWQNPHVTFTLKTVDESGAEVFWEIESHSLSIMRRMDLASPFIRTGDKVRVAGNPARQSGVKSMFVQNILLPSGEEWVFQIGSRPADLRWSDRLLGTSENWYAAEGERSAAARGIFRVWSTSFTPGRPAFFRWPADLLTESARASVAAFDAVADNPLANCAPKGMPYIMTQPYPIEFVDQNDTILVRIEEYDTVRTIHMSSDARDEQRPRSLLGHSVGRWDDDTLVVRTRGVNYPYYNSAGLPQGPASEYVERFTVATDGSELRYQLTVTDPDTFTEPVTVNKSWIWISDATVEPYDCTASE